MSLGGDTARNVTTSQTSAPWAGQEPYLTQGFSKSQELLNQPKSYFPNSTVVPFSGQTEQALTNIENRANTGSPVLGAAQGQAAQTLNGNFLGQGNPYFDQMMQQVGQSIRPQLDAQFAGSGSYGGSAHANAAADALTQAGTQMRYGDYNNERNRQMGLVGQAPALAQADYVDPAALQQVGAAREAQGGAQLQDQINRFNFGQTEPDQRLAQYMATVGGGNYGIQGTTQSPVFSNPLAQYGGLGLGLLSQFGKFGAFGSG